jgi:hypothetical protein
MWDELHRPATAITFSLFLASTAIAIYLYHLGERFSRISFAVEQVQIYDKTRAGPLPITIHDVSGNTIEDNIFVATITIWNSGNIEIKPDDIRQPYRLSAYGNLTRTMDVTPIFFTSENIDGFAIDPQTGIIRWQHFDPGEGFRARMIYASPMMQKIGFHGQASGAELKEIDIPDKSSQLFTKIAIYIGSIFYCIAFAGLLTWWTGGRIWQGAMSFAICMFVITIMNWFLLDKLLSSNLPF